MNSWVRPLPGAMMGITLLGNTVGGSASSFGQGVPDWAQQHTIDCTWTIEGMSTVDKVAAVWGNDSCLDTPRTGGAAVSWKGRWLTVYQLQPDGSWMIVRDSGEPA